jgi:hypothetical protein
MGEWWLIKRDCSLLGVHLAYIGSFYPTMTLVIVARVGLA